MRRSIPDGFFSDTLIRLPLPSQDLSGYYEPTERLLVYQPISGSGPLVGGCSFVVNPWYSFTDTIQYTYQNAGTTSTAVIPTFCANAAISQFLPLPGQNTTQTWTNSKYNQPTTTTYTGYSRVHGVEIDIEYTGTLLNCGGTISIFHGGGAGSGAFTTANNSFSPYNLAWPTVQAMQLNTETTTTMRFGQRCRFVWRPHHLDFKSVSTYREGDIYSAAAGAVIVESGVSQTHDFLAADNDPSRPVDCPYGLAIVLRLADPQNYSSGSSLPLIIKCRIIADERLTYSKLSNSDRNTSVSNNTVPPVHNSMLRDHFHNRLMKVHRARCSHRVADSDQPFTKIAESVAEGAASSIGEKIAAAF